MKITKLLKKSFALLMAACMVLVLCACNGKKGPETEEENSTDITGKNGDIEGVEKVRLEHVYTAEYLDFQMPEGENINNMSSFGELIYLQTNYYSENTDADGNYTYESGSKLYSVKPDGTELTMIKSFPQSNEQGKDSQTYTYSYINFITPVKDGTIWYYLQETFEDYSDPENYVYENKGNIVHIDASGTEIGRIDVSSYSDSEYFYVNQMLLCPEGELVVFYDAGILILDNDGKVLFTIKNDNQNGGWFGNFAVTGNGDVIGDYTTQSQTGTGAETIYTTERKLVKINFETKALEELAAPEWNINSYYTYKSGPGSSIYMYNNNAVYIYDLAAQTMTESLNWINSDMNSNRIGNLVPLEDGRILISEYTKNYDTMRFALMSKASEAEITEKYLISLAAIYPGMELIDAIIDYNRQSSDYRIQYKDYSVYATEENWQGGAEQLNIDMISGNIPDLIMLEGLPYNNYASKGLLKDLGALMEKDETFDRAAYLENILNATSVNGKIYSIFPFFSINTVTAKTENVGAEPGWTIEELKTLMGRFPDASIFENLTRSDVLNYFSNLTMDQYINISTGECKFNSPAFVQLLEIVNTFPETIDWEEMYKDVPANYWEEQQNQYKDNKTLLRMEYLSRYESIRDVEIQFGSEATFIGFPSPSGIGASIIPYSEVAISSGTKLTSACWEFVKSLISEQYQNSLTYNFPIRHDSLAKLQEQALSAPSGGGPIAYTEAISSSVKVASGSDLDPYSQPLTQTQVDKVTNLINAVSSVQRDNKEILAIINEEAAAYFSGQKTAQAVADVIQSRAWIYVSENS